MKFRYFVDYAALDRDEVNFTNDIRPRVKHGGIWGDAGVDLFAPKDIEIEPHTFRIVETYVGFYFDPGTAAFLWPRGGDFFILGAGVVDTGYTGTIKVKILNPFNELMVIWRGNSIGQLVPFTKPYSDGIELVEKDQAPSLTARGESGRIAEQLNIT